MSRELRPLPLYDRAASAWPQPSYGADTQPVPRLPAHTARCVRPHAQAGILVPSTGPCMAALHPAHSPGALAPSTLRGTPRPAVTPDTKAGLLPAQDCPPLSSHAQPHHPAACNPPSPAILPRAPRPPPSSGMYHPPTSGRVRPPFPYPPVIHSLVHPTFPGRPAACTPSPAVQQRAPPLMSSGVHPAPPLMSHTVCTRSLHFPSLGPRLSPRVPEQVTLYQV